VNDPQRQAFMIAAGIKWVRQDVYWNQIEPSNDNGDPSVWDDSQANWGAHDQRFGNAASAGFAIIANISKNPTWAASTTCGPLDRTSLDELREFLRELVNRYKGPPYNMKYWELYNEPDIKVASPQGELYGGCWGNNGTAYAQMLAVAGAAIHGADPEARVLLGPLAYEWWNGDFFNSGIDPSITPGPTEWSTSGSEFPDFLEVVLNNGGGDHFDVMSFHDYIVFHPRWDLPDDGSLPGDVAYSPACSGSTDLMRRPQEGDILGKLIYLRKRLIKHNAAYGAKPLIVSEVGRRSDTNQPMLQQGCLGGNVPGSDEQQSRYAVQVNVRAMAARLEAAIWYKLVDDGVGNYEYGLLRTDLSRKPAYWAYKTGTDELKEAVYDHQMTDGETGWTDVEGYEFRLPNGKRKWVLWTPTKLSGETVRAVSFAASQVRVVPKQKYNETYPDTEIPGVVVVIVDGGAGDLDGVVNGQVKLNVSASPIFVEDVSPVGASAGVAQAVRALLPPQQERGLLTNPFDAIYRVVLRWLGLD